ncbi:hypothetical protein H2200_012582 [Cladophialophora chaetospira]|uniref:Xylanolytic transcriptional activator regulatory domain-containing protein n=1 Tax=Cladophialophora chaetospira TaxID=386627 RepID=A0AA38WX97_9EURO|nr:hypothetical protein H2200_012582 [Cladophialophora chaetospira]
MIGERAAQASISGFVAEADDTHVIIHDVGTRAHPGDLLAFQESFSPSFAAIFLEDGMSDQNFWHPSDKTPLPESQRENASFPQCLDYNSESFQLRTCAAGTRVTPAVASRSNSLEHKRYALTVSGSLVKELVDIFFDRVSGFLPILHRPRFYARHFPSLRASTGVQGLSLETALILNGMMSLAARFSNSAHFMGTVPTRRGETFAKEAQSIYADATRLQGEEFSPTLEYLQGCILLAFYHNTNASNSFGWTLTGVCTRLAYDLEIDLVDEDICDQGDPFAAQADAAEDWVLREDLRRAWWSVWELDTFASTVARRPYTIDRTKMYVLLPVSDECWFNEQPLDSAPMGATPSTAWRSLQGSPNQDERAWFLVANFLMSLAYDLKATKVVSQQAKTEMESALDCFSLSLPTQFRTTPCSFVFSDSTFARSNWVITTKIILQSARTYQALTVCVSEGSTPSPSASPISVHPTAEDQQVACQKCVQHAKDVLRAMKVWSPDYIAFSSPFIVCSLVGPAAMHILQACTEEPTAALSRLDRDIVYLGISQFARYWGLGALMQDSTGFPSQGPAKVLTVLPAISDLTSEAPVK